MEIPGKIPCNNWGKPKVKRNATVTCMWVFVSIARSCTKQCIFSIALVCSSAPVRRHNSFSCLYHCKCRPQLQQQQHQVKTWPTQQKCSQGFLLAASCLSAWKFCCLPRQSRKLKGSFTGGDPAGTQTSTSQHRCLAGLLGQVAKHKILNRFSFCPLLYCFWMGWY